MDLANEQVILAVLWISLMLIYLLGDVLRIFAGDFKQGEMDGKALSGNMWTVAAVMMVIPIVMVVCNILITHQLMKWPNIVVSVGFFLMNIAGIKGYKFYDQLLLIISFIINFVTVYIVFTI